jgi:transcriptional regulator with XRE-family HTH domain
MLAQLRRARIKARMTQVEVATALGKTQAFVSKCELGERRIDPVELSDFARLYRRSVDSFLRGPASTK